MIKKTLVQPARSTVLPCYGPQTRKRLLRTALIYASLVFVGTALIIFAPSSSAKAFGAGLIVPGGGFLSYAVGDPLQILLHVALFFAVLFFFGLAIIAWFGAGMAIAPPFIWLASAIGAATMSHPLVSGIGDSGAGISGIGSGAFLWLPCGGAIFAALVLFIILTAPEPRTKALHVPPRTSPTPQSRQSKPKELSLDELERMRFALDRALQPLDAFEGFQWVDQFQPAGMRYQLNFAGYALALAQRRLPAFSGYLHQAQVNLIEKQRDWRVWRYWRLENAWGNLRLDADPIIRDNIMFSGFVGAQIAAFQGATGDTRFSEDGGFTLETPKGREMRHDFKTMTDALLRGWRCSPYALMPCEPNWVYPLCNGIGAGAVIARDAQFERNDWQSVAADLRAGLDTELATRTGRLVAFRSTLTGIAPPRIGGVAADASPALFYNASFPDVSARLWEIMRADALRDDALVRSAFWPIDTGDYRFARGVSFASAAAAAAELGDGEMLRLALEALEEHCPSHKKAGSIHRANISVFGHFLEMMARLGEKDGWSKLMHSPLPDRKGPMLTEAPYPQSLVAKASAHNNELQIVLYPSEDATTVTIKAEGFDANAKLSSELGEHVANGDGSLTLDVPLTGRTEITIRMRP